MNVEFATVKIKTPVDEFSPKIKDWQLFFPKKDGLENRERVMKVFIKFLRGKTRRINFGNKTRFVLGGRTYKKEGYQNGYEIFTPYIRSLKRINHKERDLVCATTINGNVYYFDADNHNRHMKLMIKDFMEHHKPKETPGYYLPYMFLTHDFL